MIQNFQRARNKYSILCRILENVSDFGIQLCFTIHLVLYTFGFVTVWPGFGRLVLSCLLGLGVACSVLLAFGSSYFSGSLHVGPGFVFREVLPTTCTGKCLQRFVLVLFLNTGDSQQHQQVNKTNNSNKDLTDSYEQSPVLTDTLGGFTTTPLDNLGQTKTSQCRSVTLEVKERHWCALTVSFRHIRHGVWNLNPSTCQRRVRGVLWDSTTHSLAKSLIDSHRGKKTSAHHSLTVSCETVVRGHWSWAVHVSVVGHLVTTFMGMRCHRQLMTNVHESLGMRQRPFWHRCRQRHGQSHPVFSNWKQGLSSVTLHFSSSTQLLRQASSGYMIGEVPFDSKKLKLLTGTTSSSPSTLST